MIRGPLADAFLGGLSKMLCARMGLHFPRERWDDLEKGLASACRELGSSDPASCARWLLSAPMTQGQVEILASHLTVGETYFLRDARSFEVLEQRVLPDLLRSRSEAEWRLRVWSAGCCTGEEPYSIAMLLDRVLPNSRKRNLTILATDINPIFLRKAAQGVYGEWSFRAMPGWMRERYFTRRSDGRHEVRPEIRRMVTFSYLNLADDAFPSLATNTNALDVIFCRNVLMYFAPVRVAATAARLHRALCDGGWLFVSPSEMSQALFPQFAMADLGGALAYRKSARSGPQAVVAQPSPASGAAGWRAVAETAIAPFDDAQGSAVRTRPPVRSGDVEDVVQLQPLAGAAAPPFEAARREANEGRLDAALAWCDKALAADRLDPMHHYLHAMIQLERGQREAAALAFERTLYLAPGFVLAHVAMGNLRVGQGRHVEARRHFGNALELLRKLPDDAVVPESEGLTAGRMADIVTSLRLSLLPASAGLV